MTDPARLLETLDELHRQLASVDDLDEHARDELREAVEEIQGALAVADLREPEGIGDRIRAAMDRFEGAHPNLVAAINRVADALSDLGI